MTAYLDLPRKHQTDIWNHLLPLDDDGEQAAFAFARHLRLGAENRFQLIEWHAVPRHGLTAPNPYHIELTDETKANMIKRAHDLDACLVEFHSHPGPWPAAFSEIDRAGLAEFVPHVRWRLRQRPYVAIVVTNRDFDGLVWTAQSREAQRLDGIRVGHEILLPTKLSELGSNHD